MDTLRTLMLDALIGVPLVLFGLSSFERYFTRRALVNIIRGMLVVVAVSTLALKLTAELKTSHEFSLAMWLQLPNFEVTVGGQLDGLACATTLLTCCVLWMVLAAWPNERSLSCLMLAWFGVTLANFASNLGQLFFGWTLSAWASSELARKPLDATTPGLAFRPVWLVQRVSDIVFFAGLGLIWMHFGGSLQLSSVTSEAVATLRPDLVESISLCVLIGVMGRCAQLPFTVWLETETGFAAQRGGSIAKLSDEMVGVWNVPEGHHVADRLKADPTNRWQDTNRDVVSSPMLAWWLCAAFLPVGITALARFESLVAAAPNTRLLMVAVGSFTLVMCSACAAAQNAWSQVLGQIAVGQCGSVLMAFGLDDPSGIALGFFTLLWQSFFVAGLFIASSKRANRSFGPIGILSLLLASGFWGRQTIGELVWRQWDLLFGVDQGVIPEAERVVLGATASRLLPFCGVLICVSEFLLAFALFRACFLQRRIDRASAVENSAPTRVSPLTMFVLLVAVIGAWLGSDFDRWTSLVADSKVDSVSAAETGQTTSLVPFSIGFLWPLSLAGIVFAWWLYAKPSSLPQKLFSAMGPFARLSRNRFYWNDLYFLLLVHPATVIGRWLAAADERFFGRGLPALRSRVVADLGESADPLANVTPMVGALTTWGSIAVLAWLLLWLR